MRKLNPSLSFGIVALVLLVLNTHSSAQSMFRVQMKLPPQGQVGNNYAYQALNLYNNESGTLTIRLKVIVSEASIGTVYEAESGNFECTPGFSTLKPEVIQSVNVTQINPGIADHIRRYQSLPGGNYRLCVTAFVAGSNSPTARDCYEESVIVTDPAMQKQDVPEEPAEQNTGPSNTEMFGNFEYTMACDKAQVKPGDMLTYTIILKCKSLKNIQGWRMKIPFPPQFTLQKKTYTLIRKGGTVTELEPEKFALRVDNGYLLFDTGEEIALQEEMIISYTVLISPDAPGMPLQKGNVTIETSVPQSRNTVKSGPLINIVR